MFKSEVYVRRRAELSKKMQTGLALFIGNGEWSRKVSNILVASESRLKPVVISARGFLNTEKLSLPGTGSDSMLGPAGMVSHTNV